MVATMERSTMAVVWQRGTGKLRTRLPNGSTVVVKPRGDLFLW